MDKINSIDEFNGKSKNIIMYIESKQITELDLLDTIIDPIIFNNDNGETIHELSVNESAFATLKQETKSELHNLLNTVLTKECRLRQNREIEIQPGDMDELIRLIDQKIELIINMIK